MNRIYTAKFDLNLGATHCYNEAELECRTENPLLCFKFAVTGFGWLVVLRINVNLAIFQPYLDLEAGDIQSLKIQVARPGIEPRSSCSASQELNHSATAAPCCHRKNLYFINMSYHETGMINF